MNLLFKYLNVCHASDEARKEALSQVWVDRWARAICPRLAAVDPLQPLSTNIAASIRERKNTDPALRHSFTKECLNSTGELFGLVKHHKVKTAVNACELDVGGRGIGAMEQRIDVG